MCNVTILGEMIHTKVTNSIELFQKFVYIFYKLHYIRKNILNLVLYDEYLTSVQCQCQCDTPETYDLK